MGKPIKWDFGGSPPGRCSPNSMGMAIPELPRAVRLLGLCGAAAVLMAAYFARQPKILFFGFPGMYRFLLAEAASQSGVQYAYWGPERVDDPGLGQPDLTAYRVIYVSGRRSDPLSRPVRKALDEAGQEGARVIVLPAHDSARLGVGNADFAGADRWIDDYWRFGGVENMSRLLQASAARYLGKGLDVLEPMPMPDDGYYHPDAPGLMTTTAEYERWYESSGRLKLAAPRVLIDFADGWRLGMNRATDAVLRAFEDGGFNAAAIFGTAQSAPFAVQFRPDVLVSRRHGRWWLGEPGVEVLEQQLDVPLLRGLSLLFTGESFADYRTSRAGIRDAGLIMGAMVPELDGAIQPTLIEGLDSEWYGRRFEAYQEERIALLLERARRWVHLRKTSNSDKRVAIFYVSGIGKGRITAASLNVPRSLVRFLAAMEGAGYRIANRPASDEALLGEMLEKGRNVSTGRPRELRELADSQGVVLLPVERYTRWFGTLPEEMRLEVIESFGPPPGALMTLERAGAEYFVVPTLDYGNVIVLPQPVRGAEMDSSLQHNDRVPPPHQYLAVYWWLREVWKADAILNYGTHGTHEFLPGRPLGQLADDWSDRTLGPLPNLYVYVMDNVGEALIAKRRGAAVTVSHQIPPVEAASILQSETRVSEVYRTTLQMLSADEGALKEELRSQVRSLSVELGLDHDIGLDWAANDPTDTDVERLSRHIHLTDDDRIPVGLHVHGQPNTPDELAPMVADMLGDEITVKSDCSGVAPADCERRNRERRERMVARAFSGGGAPGFSRSLSTRLAGIREAFAKTPTEITHTLDALEGRYVPPGGGGDPLRNPQALPTGRNLHGINPAEVPTKAAWAIGKHMAEEQLRAERERLGRWPRRIGFTLWNTELIRQHGTDLAHVLFLLGVRPVWDHRGIVEDVELMRAAELGRPRVDVVVQAASLFRDTFPDRMRLLDKAVRLAASATDGENFIAEHTEEAVRELKLAGLSARDARTLSAARVFSNSAGGYGTGLVGSIERSGSYSGTEALTDAYLARTGAVYTEGYEWGRPVPAAYRQHLRHTDAVTLSRSTNVVGALTLDHYFEYLGGMTMAVRDTSGVAPETYIADVRDAAAPRVETLREALSRGLRGKFWNAKWIRGLQDEGYSGAVEIAQTATNLFGWNVTKPAAVDSQIWQRVHEVYVQDSLALGIPRWLDSENPYAQQEVVAILLESARKGFWDASAEHLVNLAVHYAESLELHGASGSVRTTGNRPFEEFVEVRLAQSARPELAAMLREELRDGSDPRVEGRILLSDKDRGDATDAGFGDSAMLGVAGVLAGAFLLGWRRLR